MRSKKMTVSIDEFSGGKASGLVAQRKAEAQSDPESPGLRRRAAAAHKQQTRPRAAPQSVDRWHLADFPALPGTAASGKTECSESTVGEDGPDSPRTSYSLKTLLPSAPSASASPFMEAIAGLRLDIGGERTANVILEGINVKGCKKEYGSVARAMEALLRDNNLMPYRALQILEPEGIALLAFYSTKQAYLGALLLHQRAVGSGRLFASMASCFPTQGWIAAARAGTLPQAVPTCPPFSDPAAQQDIHEATEPEMNGGDSGTSQHQRRAPSAPAGGLGARVSGLRLSAPAVGLIGRCYQPPFSGARSHPPSSVQEMSASGVTVADDGADGADSGEGTVRPEVSYQQAIVLGCNDQLLRQYHQLGRFMIQSSSLLDAGRICSAASTALLLLNLDDQSLHGLWEATWPAVGTDESTGFAFSEVSRLGGVPKAKYLSVLSGFQAPPFFIGRAVTRDLLAMMATVRSPTPLEQPSTGDGGGERASSGKCLGDSQAVPAADEASRVGKEEPLERPTGDPIHRWRPPPYRPMA